MVQDINTPKIAKPIISILASALVGVILYFVSASLAVKLTGCGLGALALVLIIAPLSISLSSGLIYD